jgi:hypothetical protein
MPISTFLPRRRHATGGSSTSDLSTFSTVFKLSLHSLLYNEIWIGTKRTSAYTFRLVTLHHYLLCLLQFDHNAQAKDAQVE